ncbi:hypothetical protein [Arthrobacter mobilis]|uniref:Uncharacterized protein n=1 Tax=Arthrobacter mobilis TaxID=2724944 RepID=A0A7X6HCM4_9MICC|nr:hypothetical protein [Arthrobacter mobilis]NKX54664.1 hypothetical protein [Arthrobacter mobilis]
MARTAAAVLSPAVVWAAVLVLAPFAQPRTDSPLLWGAGAALLVCAVPRAIAAALGPQLRPGLGRLGLAPLAAGTGVLMYGMLRVIRWWHGPLSLAAVIFAIFAGYALLLLARRHRPLDWPAMTCGAAAAILPLLLGPPGLAALPVLGLRLWAAAALRSPGSGHPVVSAAAGAMVCGGLCALLLQAIR